MLAAAAVGFEVNLYFKRKGLELTSMIFGLKRLETLILQYIQVKYILSRNQQKNKKDINTKRKRRKTFSSPAADSRAFNRPCNIPEG